MKVLRDLILENWGLKLMAVFLAWILWLFVRGEPNAERVITIPLEIRIPANMEITNERPNTVDVTVRGTLSNAWFGPQIPTCTINLQGFGEGEHVVPLSPSDVRLPRASGLEVLKINPARVTLDIEKTISKEVPIAVPTRGEPAEGYDVYGKSVTPNLILITGPRTHVDAIKQVATEPISVGGQKESIRVFANLSIRDNLVRSKPVGPVEVHIILGVHRKLTTVAGVPLQVEDNRYLATPLKISVVLLAPVNIELGPQDIAATVSTDNLGSSKLPVRIAPAIRLSTNLDPNVVIVKEVQPPMITVSLRKSSRK